MRLVTRMLPHSSLFPWQCKDIYQYSFVKIFDLKATYIYISFKINEFFFRIMGNLIIIVKYLKQNANAKMKVQKFVIKNNFVYNRNYKCSTNFIIKSRNI